MLSICPKIFKHYTCTHICNIYDACALNIIIYACVYGSLENVGSLLWTLNELRSYKL